jgi:hypothetical protein
MGARPVGPTGPRTASQVVPNFFYRVDALKNYF